MVPSNAALATEREQSQETTAETQRAQAQTAYGERLAVAKERLHDYDEVLETSDVMVNDMVTEALFESELGPDIVYHLAQHPEEATRLNLLSPVALGRELGKLEARLQPPEAEQPPASTSETPPEEPPQQPPFEPTNPVRGSGAGDVNRPLENLSYQDYKAERLKQRRRR